MGILPLKDMLFHQMQFNRAAMFSIFGKNKLTQIC